MIDNRELYSFEEENRDQIQSPENENENEEETTISNGFPSKLISHIITSLFCLLIILAICRTDSSWGIWIRNQLHMAINASTQDTFGYLSNTELIKNVVKNGSSLIRLEEITRISAQKLHFPDQIQSNNFPPSIWPVQGNISQGFGWQENQVNHTRQFNPGVEYTTEFHTDVMAISDGEVVSVSQSPKTGNEIVIDHQNGWTSSYRLIDGITVRAGQSVESGSVIAKTSGNKLVLEIRHRSQPVDPLTVIVN